MGKQTGLTLMELMVVIAIIGIISAIATPNAISWVRNAEFSSAVRKVKITLEDMRTKALKSCAPSKIIFNNDNTLQIIKWDRDLNPPGYGPSQEYKLRGDITVSSDFAGNEIVYNSRGMAQHGLIDIQSGSGLCRRIEVFMVGSSRIIKCP